MIASLRIMQTELFKKVFPPAITVFVVAILFANSAHAQSKLYYNESLIITSNEDSIKYYGTLEYMDSGQIRMKQRIYSLNNQPYGIFHYADSARKILQGKQTYFNEDGGLQKETNYANGRLDGTFKTFWPSGQLRREDQYISGEFQNGKCYGTDGNDTIYVVYQKTAGFPGGAQALSAFLNRSIKYPNEERRNDITGIVQVKFTVNLDGSISNISILKSVSDGLDKEALRIVGAMPNWTPTEIEGEKIKKNYILPIVFRLE